MSRIDDAPWVEVVDRATWRAWLAAHHATASGAWLVTWRPSSDRPTLDYEAAVEEALCFGWIDSTGGSVDADRRRLYFAPRKARSVWSASNKARVERLAAAGLMTRAGLAAVEQAKATGAWEILDGPERGEVPADLAVAFEAAGPSAATNFAAFPPSARKQALAWIALARRPETRANRILETATLVARGERGDQGRTRED